MIDYLLRKLERFGPVAEDERAFLVKASGRLFNYSPNSMIVEQDSSPSDSCIVIQGFAGRIKFLPDGTRQILAFHIPGDFCDLHGFLLQRMDHGIMALTQCVIAKIAHTHISEITERFPRLTRALWWDTAIDAAVLREWMISMGRRSAYEQMAHLLCELLLRLRIVGLVKSDSFELPVTQEQLGDAFGLSSVHVNRMLQALRRGNLIVSNGKCITIPDVEALKEAAGFDPSYLEVKGAPKH